MKERSQEEAKIVNDMITQWSPALMKQVFDLAQIKVSPVTAVTMVVDATLFAAASVLMTSTQGRLTEQQVGEALKQRIDLMMQNTTRIYAEQHENGETTILGGLQ